MATLSARGRSRTAPLLILGVVAVVATMQYLEHRKRFLHDESLNFSLKWTKPAGWVEVPHSPQALFLYRQPKTHLLIRGAMSDIVAEVNPTPELDRDGTAKWMLDVTSENQKEWQGTMLDSISANGTEFRLVHRWCKDKSVYSAISVKGNTTVLITMSANRAEMPDIDAAVPAFRSYLAGLTFVPHVYQE